MQEFRPDIPKENRLIIDWLSFTITDKSTEDIADMLGLSLSDFSPFRGRYGYKQRLSCGGIHFLIDGTPDANGKQNICVEMSGQGCRDWETLGYPDYYKIISMAASGELKLTRIDIAYDDFIGLLPFNQIIEKSIDLKEVVSTWRSWCVTYSDRGASVTYGSRSSLCYARCYDKAAERGYTNGEHWIRFETVFKDEVALQLASLICSRGFLDDSLYFSILKDKIRYVDSSDDSNKSRWPTSQFWDYLTNNADGIHLKTNLGDLYNLDAKEYHLFQQYGKSIVTIILTRGFSGFVDDLLNGNIELNSRYKSICMKNGLSPGNFSISELYKLKAAIDDIKQAEFDYHNPKIKVGGNGVF